jgi:flagellar hook-basal body complex protein FliE
MMDIASIMSKVMPGTFAPDMSDSEAPSISALPGVGAAVSNAVNTAADAAGTAAVGGARSFKDTVNALLADVNNSINTSDQNTRDLASGKTNDVNKVVTSVEEANLALQYTMAIRTKLLEAYTSVSQMSV